jgi:hypothetical protein
MAKDKTTSLRSQKEHLTEWLRRTKKTQDAVPIVQTILEVTDWEIEALDNSPEEADEIPLAGLTAKLERDHIYLTSALPLPPDYSKVVLLNVAAVTTSGSANVYDYVARVGDLGTPQATSYSQKFSGLYRDLLEAHSRPQTVRDLLTKLNNPQTLERFDRAYNAYMAAKSEVGERPAAATEMRTLLDGVKGDLFQLARRSPDENMTWDKMVERLSKGISGGPEHQELVRQGSERSRLISRLSDVLKDREGGSVTNLDNVWTLLLDHTFTVLGLIDFGSI